MVNKHPNQDLNHICIISKIGLFPLYQCPPCCLSPRKESGWDGILSALASCSQPQRRSTSFQKERTFSFGSWSQREKPIICHYLLLGASSRLREPVPSSEPRELPLMGFPLPVLWLQQKAKKPHNYLYLFENRPDHICLPCRKQNKQWHYQHPHHHPPRKTKCAVTPYEAIGCRFVFVAFQPITLILPIIESYAETSNRKH